MVMKIITDISEIKKYYEIKKDENDAFIERYKNLPDIKKKEIDLVVKKYYEKLKKIIDCKKCGNCCKEIIIVFEPHDLSNLSKKLKKDIEKIKNDDFIYYKKHNVYIMNQSPCKYLKNNLCSIYKYRGTECREFPYLDSKNFSSIYNYVLSGYKICPFYFNIIEFLKTILTD